MEAGMTQLVDFLMLVGVPILVSLVAGCVTYNVRLLRNHATRETVETALWLCIMRIWAKRFLVGVIVLGVPWFAAFERGGEGSVLLATALPVQFLIACAAWVVCLPQRRTIRLKGGINHGVITDTPRNTVARFAAYYMTGLTLVQAALAAML
jgi:hypothetical protein